MKYRGGLKNTQVTKLFFWNFTEAWPNAEDEFSNIQELFMELWACVIPVLDHSYWDEQNDSLIVKKAIISEEWQAHK